jgi:glycosyltransferase involved in cell wall biosynthesis
MVAVIFHRIGPYHDCRIRAAAQQVQVTCVELCAKDSTYEWEVISNPMCYRRETLYEHGDVTEYPAMEVNHRLSDVLDALKPDVVAIPGWLTPGAPPALFWCIKHGVPAMVMSESQRIDEPRKWHKEFIKRQIVSLFSAGLVGGRTHGDYLADLGMSPECIFLGYDAVDNDYFAAGAAKWQKLKAESRNQKPDDIGRTTDPSTLAPMPYFLASARFIEKKNLPRLIQAYARYRQFAQTSDLRRSTSAVWNLVLLGDGPLKADLCHLISDLRLQDFVLLPGFKQYPDLPAYYGLARAFIHASTTEQWGLVVNEAMASGLAVLVSNRCGCAQDLVREGVNGFTFDPYNIEKLAELMVKVSAFNFPLSAFGDASQRIISAWGPERFANGLKAAVECALRVGPVKPTLIQRILLKALLAR